MRFFCLLCLTFSDTAVFTFSYVSSVFSWPSFSPKHSNYSVGLGVSFELTLKNSIIFRVFFVVFFVSLCFFWICFFLVMSAPAALPLASIVHEKLNLSRDRSFVFITKTQQYYLAFFSDEDFNSAPEVASFKNCGSEKEVVGSDTGISFDQQCSLKDGLHDFVSSEKQLVAFFTARCIENFRSWCSA